MKSNALVKVLIAALLLSGAALQAQAAQITWNLAGVTFSDGTTATGSITMDPTARTSSAFSVSTIEGNLSAFTFDDSNSGLYFGGGAGPNNFILFTNTGWRYFNFSFMTALDAAGGTFGLNLATSYECMNCSPWRMVTAGALTSVAAAVVPEPGTAAMLLPALGMLGWMSRRRRAPKA